ncbi:MAG: archaeosortase/exosortase family protein [Prevotella sp.]|jgi:exosortase/archaeosortase family protein|nr:archaeosortase/exosortase family protein [Prevotella sp.]
MSTKIKNFLNNFYQKLKPFKDIIWFLCLFLIFEFIWKLCVHVGDDERVLLVLGKDLTKYTEGMCLWTAESVYWFIHDLLGYHDFHINGNILQFKNSIPIEIVWGCTGLKQLFMFTFIIVFYFGPAKKKLWYIPMSLIILIIVNILRLAIIFLIIRNPFPEWFITVNEWYNNRTWSNTKENYIEFYKDWFNVFHRDIFTWLYYDGIIFILWLIWEEKINKPYLKLKGKVSSAIANQIN